MTTDRAGYIAHRLVRDLPGLMLALFGALGPTPSMPRGHQGPAPFMRPRSQAKRRRLARRRTTR
jgi:hypothetical protein